MAGDGVGDRWVEHYARGSLGGQSQGDESVAGDQLCIGDAHAGESGLFRLSNEIGHLVHGATGWDSQDYVEGHCTLLGASNSEQGRAREFNQRTLH